jgi:chromosome segregation and condensation protein ScpB
MSYIKRFIEDVMVLYEEGVSIAEIAEVLRLDRDLVENVVEQYSNFYD